jgi:hypothetical protein
MALRDWLTIGLIGVGMVFQVGLAIDRWVHQQSFDSVAVEAELKRLRETLDAANARWSEKMSGLQSWVGRMELELVRLRARDEMREQEPRKHR